MQVVNHLCKSQRNFWLTECDFQQFHHLVVGEIFRRNQKTFQHSGTGTQSMHTGFAGQLRYLMLQNFLAVLVVAQLLLGFGFFAAEIGKGGFGLGHGITLLYNISDIRHFCWFVVHYIQSLRISWRWLCCFLCT